MNVTIHTKSARSKKEWIRSLKMEEAMRRLQTDERKGQTVGKLREALPHLKKSQTAAIVNICSVVSHSGYPMQSIYSASKHALLGMTKSLAREYFKEGIRVHAISPGGVYTDMVKLSRPDLSPEGMITPGEIADIIEFLLVNRGNAVIDEILVHRVGKEPFLV